MVETLQQRLEAAVAQAETNAGLMHDVVHGGPTETVTTEGGPIDSLAKRLAELGAAYAALDAVAACAAERALADAAKVAAQAARDAAVAALATMQDRLIPGEWEDEFPALDVDGSALDDGDLCYHVDTVNAAFSGMYVYSLGEWKQLGGGALLIASLLSEIAALGSAAQATARANLGARALDVAQNAQSVSYTLALSDRGKGVDTSAEVIVPPNSSVAFPIGSEIYITNTSASAINITQGSGVTLRRSGSATTGTYSLAAYGFAILRKIGTDAWMLAPAVAGYVPPDYAPAGIAYGGVNTTQTWTHGLGATPRNVKIYAKFTAAQNNYAVGDIVPIEGTSGSISNNWQTVSYNSTTIKLSNTGGIMVSDPVGHGGYQINAANVLLYCEAWK